MENDVGQQRLWWHEQGFKLVPLPPKSKIPNRPWKHIATAQTQAVEELAVLFPDGEALNTAAIIPKDILVLDCENFESESKLLEAIPELKATLRVKSGAGGHEYVKLDDSSAWQLGMWHDADGVKQIEIRVAGASHYMVVPPATHPNGNEYVFLNQTPPVVIPDLARRFNDFVTEQGWVFTSDKKPKPEPAQPVRTGSVFEQIKSKTSLRELEPTAPWRSDDTARWKCPKHGDSPTHPVPCWLNNKEGFFRCHSVGCGERGDLIHYYGLKNGLSDGQAANHLAVKLGLSVNLLITPIEKEIEPEAPRIKLKLLYPTKHLPAFQQYNDSLNLLSRDYLPLKKLHYYGALSAAAEVGVVRISSWRIDPRVSTLTTLPAGHGKQAFSSCYERVCKELRLTFGVPSSYHPEALVGKKMPVYEGKGKNKQIVNWTENRGYLDNDVVVFDECKQLLEPEKGSPQETSRVYVRTALNPYGSNLIEKAQVDVGTVAPLRYNPKCRLYLFTQSRKLKAELAQEGMIRRLLIGSVRFTGNEIQERVVETLNSKNSYSTDSFGDFLAILQRIQKITAGLRDNLEKIQFTQAAREALAKFYPVLIALGEEKGGNAAEETRIEEVTIMLDHAKIAMLYALACGRTKVEDSDVEMVFPDVVEFFSQKWDFLNQWLTGRVSFSGEVVTDRELDCLQWLAEKGAISQEKSTVTVAEFLDKVKQVFSMGGKPIADRTARNYKKKMEDKKLIDSAQVGSRGFFVWACHPQAKEPFSPMGGSLGMGGTQSSLPYYLDICKNIEGLNSTPIIPDSSGSLRGGYAIEPPIPPKPPITHEIKDNDHFELVQESELSKSLSASPKRTDTGVSHD